MRRCVPLLLLLVVSAGCAPLGGTTSLTLLARSPAIAHRLRPVGERTTERACTNWLLMLVAWGDERSHEALVRGALERSGGTVLVDATVKSSSAGFPLAFYRECKTVEGQPAVAVPGDPPPARQAGGDP